MNSDPFYVAIQVWPGKMEKTTAVFQHIKKIQNSSIPIITFENMFTTLAKI